MTEHEKDVWREFHRRWSQLTPPLRANHEVVAAIADAIGDRNAQALLLGVTPELADIATRTLAVDISPGMIVNVWPGDTESRRAVQGDWRCLALGEQRVSCVIGDGSFNVLRSDEYPEVFKQLGGVLVHGGRLAIRFYLTPEPVETLARVQEDTLAGRNRGFHALKWRLAMAVAGQTGRADVPVASIHRAFNEAFPDRASLAERTGWSPALIAEIDAYDAKSTVYSFPTASEVLGALPPAFRNARFVKSGAYELAERCPLLTADFLP